MTVTYTDTVKADRMTATRDAVANGTLEILAADDTVLAIFGLSASGGSIVDDVWTLTFDATTVQGETGAGAGTDATKAQIKDSGGTVQISGLTVGEGSEDIVFDNSNIADGQDVTLSSATVTHAA